VSTRVDGATVTVTVTACATLSAGTVHMSLTAREGPVPGIWQYNLNDGTDNRAGRGTHRHPRTWPPRAVRRDPHVLSHGLPVHRRRASGGG
jgi:hypothetical protein